MFTNFLKKSALKTLPALTLIEVLAALAILGVILVGVVLAKSRHLRQLSVARSQRQLIVLADELVADWYTSADGPPVGKSGVSGSDNEFQWKTYIVDNSEIESLGARVLRCEFVPAGPGGPSAASNTKANTPVIVDIVLPRPDSEIIADES